jgi:hypothetical protein
MLDLELRDLGPPDKYDNTMRTTYKQCPRKFYWWRRRYDYLLRPGYFSFGSAWGKIKQTWYESKGISEDMGTDIWVRDIYAALAEGQKFWDESGSIDDKKGNTRHNLELLWAAYLKMYPTEPFRLVPGGAEVGWLWLLPGTDWFLGGSFDAYIDWHPYGTLPLEEKTAGIWLSDFYLRQWSFSSQITQYIWYSTQLLGSVFGCLINIACKLTAKSGETPKFARPLQTRTKDELKEFERDWKQDIEDIHRSWDKWHFPKTTDTVNCTGGIGKAPCLYQGLCLCGIPQKLVDPLAFPNIILNKEPWAPWDWGKKTEPITSPEPRMLERQERL